MQATASSTDHPGPGDSGRGLSPGPKGVQSRGINIKSRIHPDGSVLHRFILDTPAFDLSKTSVEKHFAKTTKDYRRYVITQEGVSPRGVPGYGEGLVIVD